MPRGGLLAPNVLEAARLLAPNAKDRAKTPVVHVAEVVRTNAIAVVVRVGFSGQ